MLKNGKSLYDRLLEAKDKHCAVSLAISTNSLLISIFLTDACLGVIPVLYTQLSYRWLT